MNIGSLREKTSFLDDNTPVLVSYYSLEYSLTQKKGSFDDIHFGIEGRNSLYGIPSFDHKGSTNLSTLKDLRAYEDSLDVSLDVEDGFVFRDLEHIEVIDGAVILFPK